MESCFFRVGDAVRPSVAVLFCWVGGRFFRCLWCQVAFEGLGGLFVAAWVRLFAPSGGCGGPCREVLEDLACAQDVECPAQVVGQRTQGDLGVD